MVWPSAVESRRPNDNNLCTNFIHKLNSSKGTSLPLLPQKSFRFWNSLWISLWWNIQPSSKVCSYTFTVMKPRPQTVQWKLYYSVSLAIIHCFWAFEFASQTVTSEGTSATFSYPKGSISNSSTPGGNFAALQFIQDFLNPYGADWFILTKALNWNQWSTIALDKFIFAIHNK